MLLAALLIWTVLALLKVFLIQSSQLHLPLRVGLSKSSERKLIGDIVASFSCHYGFRARGIYWDSDWSWLGHHARARLRFLPLINFFRSLSPLAWIPFAILWFGIGDLPTVFLIFMASFFPLVIATVPQLQIPSVYFRIAADYNFGSTETLMRVTLPAIAPRVIASLRVTAGLAWLVVVAEMIAGRAGLGFTIWDAQWSTNGLAGLWNDRDWDYWNHYRPHLASAHEDSQR